LLVVATFSFVNITPLIGREGWVFCTSQEIGCEYRFWKWPVSCCWDCYTGF